MATSKHYFEKDFAIAVERYPKLSFHHNKKTGWTVTGELDICDVKGIYWGTFKIRIFVRPNYPFCVPFVQELSKLIPRHIDWHVDKDGYCCLDIHHKLLYLASRGLTFVDFMDKKVYPFFANQLYRRESTGFAGGEYAHHFAGVEQFYKDDLKLNPTQALSLLENLTSKNPAGRNKLCPCGSGKKFKHCHIEAAQILLSIGKKVLLQDLLSFRSQNQL